MGKRWCWLGGGLGEIPAASADMTDLILRGYDGWGQECWRGSADDRGGREIWEWRDWRRRLAASHPPPNLPPGRGEG